MKFGVVLPIWQLTVGDAEALAVRAEALGLDGVFVPDHATLSELAARAGRRGRPGLAPRNLLDLTERAGGSGRAAFQGTPAEIAADVRRVRDLGADWMTFDLPRADVAGMMRAMERLASDVKPAAA
jgi:alkanesulfonate monooxygenase SsuD/methylene tetrahydromethanopterin reductase-like flavin-dependent oxidoreductase (luciferase family)